MPAQTISPLSSKKNYPKRSFWETNFCWSHWGLWALLGLLLILRLVWASYVPLANDEVYYWDWSRHLQLSYLDAPPFVAWVSFLGHFIAQGSLGARFFVPFFHFAATLFLIKSLCLLHKAQGAQRPLTYREVFFLIFLADMTPIFQIEGFALIPDAALLCFLSAALYILLRFLTLAEQKKQQWWVQQAVLLGCFLGLAGLSKYHALPIGIGFFLGYLLYRRDQLGFRDIVFWLICFVVAICIASPVFIWNAQNHMASFRFQGSHGFSHLEFHRTSFLQYISGIILYVFPWVSIPFFVFLSLFLKRGRMGLHVVAIVPFLILFTLLLVSAWGNPALPHWLMPGLFLVWPSFALYGARYIGRYRLAAHVCFGLSLLVSFGVPTFLCWPGASRVVLAVAKAWHQDPSPLYQVFLWPSLQQDLAVQHGIVVPSSPYVPGKAMNGELCSAQHPLLGSFRWYWTAQMAFYFHDQPRVWNFDSHQPSFYSWRDAGIDSTLHCPVLLIGSKDHFDEKQLSKLISITHIQELTIEPYRNIPIIVVWGELKSLVTEKEF